MPPTDNSKIKLIVLAVLVVLLIAAGAWYWLQRKAAPAVTYTPEKVAGGLGSNIFEKSQNPIVDKLPETNPFGRTGVNFFEANPLKALYKNPFE